MNREYYNRKSAYGGYGSYGGIGAINKQIIGSIIAQFNNMI